MSKETKNRVKRHPDPTGVIIGIILLLMGLAALYGWWELDSLFFKVPLYIVATLIISFAAFGIISEFTPKAKQNYSMSAMILVWSASLVYPSISTDITALRWLSVVFAGIFGFIALIAFIVQLTKDIRSRPRPTFGLITAIIIILVIYITAAYYLAYPAILVLFPFTFIVIYAEYLRSAFLGGAVKEAQSSGVIDRPKTDAVTTYLNFRIKLASRDVLRNLRGIRWSLGLISVIFLCLFLTVTQLGIEGTHFGSFYEAVIYAYVGILAIVIAFAVLVIQRRPQEPRAAHLKRALEGLVQMYVVFALIAITGFLLGTDINGKILTQSTGFREILGSLDDLLNISRILATEFTVLAFPASLLYLHAMIKDFLRS
jgi:hypothetical protein